MDHDLVPSFFCAGVLVVARNKEDRVLSVGAARVSSSINIPKSPDPLAPRSRLPRLYSFTKSSTGPGGSRARAFSRLSTHVVRDAYIV